MWWGSAFGEIFLEITLKNKVNPKGRELSGFSFPFLAHFLVFS
jgi:hypothetical protein